MTRGQRVHLERDINEIKKNIVLLCSEVQKRLNMAIDAFIEDDSRKAHEVIERDIDIDENEVKIEDGILKTLALHQPVASDLRFLIAVLKINNDIERIGDLAVNISKKALKYNRSGITSKDNTELREVTRLVSTMVQNSLESLIEEDVEKAKIIIRDDDLVDEKMDELFRETRERLKKEPEHTDGLLSKVSAYRFLERVGDHATNIAEDIIYYKEGRIVRHTKTLE